MSDHVPACRLSRTLFPLKPRSAPKKSNYDTLPHMVTFVGLASSHDLMESVVFVDLTGKLQFTVSLKRGSFTKAASKSRGFRGSRGFRCEHVLIPRSSRADLG